MILLEQTVSVGGTAELQGTPWGQQAKELNQDKINHMWENDLSACLRSGFVSISYPLGSGSAKGDDTVRIRARKGCREPWTGVRAVMDHGGFLLYPLILPLCSVTLSLWLQSD